MSPIVSICLRKSAFPDKATAWQYIRRWEAMGRCAVGTLTPYHCSACQHIHVGTTRRKEGRV